jgi:signal transduction histidine kinase
MRLGAIQARGLDPAFGTEVAAARAELHIALEELRHLAHGIYPATLTQAGLGPALEAVVEGLPVPVTLDVPAERWRPEVESTAYFVACEALTNVAKHAGDCSAQLRVDADGDELCLQVVDTGTGQESLNQPAALSHLRDRLAALGGTLSVTSRPGHGTSVTARIPCG